MASFALDQWGVALGAVACVLMCPMWSYGAGPVSIAAPCQRPSTIVVPDVPWAQQRLAPISVWHLTRGEGVTVAVIDTGVDAGVPQLQGKVLGGRDLAASGSGRADNDCLGHGTFAAGIIAAQPRSGSGFVGVAPAAKVLPIRVADDDAVHDLSRLASGVRAAVDAGAPVIAITLDRFVPVAGFNAAVEYAASHDVLVVAPVARAEPGTPGLETTSANALLTVGAVAMTGPPGPPATATPLTWSGPEWTCSVWDAADRATLPAPATRSRCHSSPVRLRSYGRTTRR